MPSPYNMEKHAMIGERCKNPETALIRLLDHDMSRKKLCLDYSTKAINFVSCRSDITEESVAINPQLLIQLSRSDPFFTVVVGIFRQEEIF